MHHLSSTNKGREIAIPSMTPFQNLEPAPPQLRLRIKSAKIAMLERQLVGSGRKRSSDGARRGKNCEPPRKRLTPLRSKLRISYEPLSSARC
jgi:hypothetical protein